MSIALSILPLVLTILCGYLLVVTNAVPKDQWLGLETLSFRLLIPVMLMHTIAFSDLSAVQSGSMLMAVLLAVAVISCTVIVIRQVVPRSALSDPSFTTIFQTTVRWNAFISLAAAELFAGPDTMALLAIAIAVLIPVNNIINIIVMAAYGSAKTSALGAAKLVITNPIVQGCLIGVALGMSGQPIPDFVEQTLDLIGRAALGVGILAVGAGIRLRRLMRSTPQLWAGVGLRLIYAPAVFYLLALVLGLGPTETLAGVLVFAVPAATNGYIVAKQMGGDADLYADVLAWQTVLTMFLLPILMAVMT